MKKNGWVKIVTRTSMSPVGKTQVTIKPKSLTAIKFMAVGSSLGIHSQTKCTPSNTGTCKHTCMLLYKNYVPVLMYMYVSIL